MSATKSPNATSNNPRTIMKHIVLAALTALPLIAAATEYRIEDRPRQECWNEQVPVQTAGGDVGGALLGGIAGGLIGNQVGNGNGRVVATAVGAMTGAVVGDRMANAGPGYRTVQRCRTVVDQVRVPVVREPAPVYMQPQPVYAQPQPVYVQPQPVYVQPQPVVVESGYYVVPGERVYYRGHGKHHWHDGRRYRDDD
ncbi:glycine zipper 2TM domain-containing protein [Oxalobacteraceae bacterium OM1]|nr:glycine zipper 2TM domain-containing protein [Oxalobacteraceae bacterium OM1]